MSTDLPFDPPYKLALDTPQGRRWVEVLADGSQVDTTPPATTLPPPSERSAPKAPRGQTFLKVPYAEKDEAKRLGARWDAARKKWYVPQGVDVAPFARWAAD